MSEPRDTSPRPSSFRIGAWRVDPRTGEISRGGETRRLQPKVIEVLVYLVQRAGETVSKQELLDSVWAGSFVGEEALWRCIADLRRALDDDAREPEYIETLPRRGYRIAAAAVHADSPAAGSAGQPVSRPALSRRVAVALGLVAAVALCGFVVLRPLLFSVEGGKATAPIVSPTVDGVGAHRTPPTGDDVLAVASESGVPRTADDHLRLGLEYYRRYDAADVEKAIRMFERAVKLEPEMAPAWAALADAYSVKSNRFTDDPRWEQEALRAAVRAVELDPDLAAGHKALGFAYLNLGRVAESAGASRRALELDPGRHDAVHNLAYALAAQGRLDEAIFWQRKLIRAGMQTSAAFGTVGVFHLMIGDLARARRALEASLEINPFAPYASSYLGWIEILQGDPGAARRRASSCLDVEPGALPCTELLARVEQRAGNLQAARSLLEGAPASAFGTHWTMRLRLASVRAELGDRLAAEMLFDAVEQHARGRIAAGNDHWMQPARLAIVAAWRGQLEEAMEWLDRAIESGLVAYLWLREDPLFRPLRDDPAFGSRVDLMARKAAALRARIPSTEAGF